LVKRKLPSGSVVVVRVTEPLRVTATLPMPLPSGRMMRPLMVIEPAAVKSARWLALRLRKVKAAGVKVKLALVGRDGVIAARRERERVVAVRVRRRRRQGRERIGVGDDESHVGQRCSRARRDAPRDGLRGGGRQQREDEGTQRGDLRADGARGEIR
jgi:hypothetical protein